MKTALVLNKQGKISIIACLAGGLLLVPVANLNPAFAVSTPAAVPARFMPFRGNAVAFSLLNRKSDIDGQLQGLVHISNIYSTNEKTKTGQITEKSKYDAFFDPKTNELLKLYEARYSTNGISSSTTYYFNRQRVFLMDKSVKVKNQNKTTIVDTVAFFNAEEKPFISEKSIGKEKTSLSIQEIAAILKRVESLRTIASNTLRTQLAKDKQIALKAKSNLLKPLSKLASQEQVDFIATAEDDTEVSFRPLVPSSSSGLGNKDNLEEVGIRPKTKVQAPKAMEPLIKTPNDNKPAMMLSISEETDTSIPVPLKKASIGQDVKTAPHASQAIKTNTEKNPSAATRPSRPVSHSKPLEEKKTAVTLLQPAVSTPGKVLLANKTTSLPHGDTKAASKPALPANTKTTLQILAKEAVTPAETTAPGKHADYYREHLYPNLKIVVSELPRTDSQSLRKGSIRIETLDGQEVKSYEWNIDGNIQQSWVYDLDRNQKPEIVVTISSAGSGSYGGLTIFEWDKPDLKITNLPKIGISDQAVYMGHDQFQVKNGRIIRSFPVYEKGDTNHKPTGGYREIHYVYLNSELLPLQH